MPTPKIILVAIAVIFITHCSDDTGGTSPFSSADFVGTWSTGCYTDSTDGFVETFTFTGTQLTYDFDTYASSTNCSIGPSGNINFSASYAITSGQTLTWDGATPAGLTSPVEGSRLFAGAKFSFFIDQGVTPNELYFGDSVLNTDGEGYATQLYTRTFTKQ